MKEKFLLLFLLGNSISFGQFFSSYGIKAGLTFSQFKWDYTIESGLNDLDFYSDRKPGLNAGLFVEIFDGQYFSLCTEINYIEKGFQKEIYSTSSESPELGPKVLWKVNFNYIDISVLAKPKIDLGLITPYILIGPRLDVEISKSSRFDNIENYKDYLSKRLGVKCGIGSEVKLFELRFLTELIWGIDIKDIYQNSNVNVKTNSFDIRIGMMI